MTTTNIFIWKILNYVSLYCRRNSIMAAILLLSGGILCVLIFTLFVILFIYYFNFGQEHPTLNICKSLKYQNVAFKIPLLISLH